MDEEDPILPAQNHDHDGEESGEEENENAKSLLKDQNRSNHGSNHSDDEEVHGRDSNEVTHAKQVVERVLDIDKAII